MVTLEGINSYAYDARGQLTAVTYPDGSSEAFAYDPVGNRTTLVQAASGGPAIGTVYAYGPANRLLFSESAVETNVYTFDDAGRLVGQTVNGLSRTYAYDFQSRMTSLTDTNGAVFAYAFDGEGNRVRQSLNDCLSTRFVYDGANAVAEMNASNEVVWAWMHGPGLDQPVERIAFINGEARNRQVVHADGLGSVSALTDESGETVQTYAYAAFGGIREQTGTDLNRVTFTAREALGDSLGLFYYRHRVYDPTTGRFTSEDPLGFVDGVNRYVYCANNPVNYIDPLGLEVRVQWHRVAGNSWHSLITIIPDNQARYANDPRFNNVDANGRRFATLGAGPEGGRLVSNINRDTDRVAHQGGHVVNRPNDCANEDTYIDRLFTSDANYPDNLDYDLFPANPGNRRLLVADDGFNSNSYVAGLLGATGGTVARPTVNVPGWNRPVPAASFQPRVPQP